MMMKAAKTRFSGFGFIACARRTPQVVVTIVTPMTMRKAGTLTRPTVNGGLSGDAPARSRKPVTEGMAMTRPKPEAVPTARWIGTP